MFHKNAGKSVVGLLAILLLLALGAGLALWLNVDHRSDATPLVHAEDPEPGDVRDLSETRLESATEVQRKPVDAGSEPEENNAVLRVFILGMGSRPLAQGTVQLEQDDHVRAEQSVDPQSLCAVFDDLPSGDYLATIQPGSLPPGYLVPRKQIPRFRGGGQVPGLPVHVDEGQTEEIELRVESAARVWGVLLRPDGIPLTDAHVRFSCLDRSRWIPDRNLEVDDSGLYQGDLYPGSWMARVVLGFPPGTGWRLEGVRPATQALWALTNPMPAVRDLPPSSDTRLDFQYGAGSGEVTGKLIDQRGAGFGGLEIYLCPLQVTEPQTGEVFPMGLTAVAKTVSDEDGLFNIQGVEPGQYRVQIEPEGFLPTARPGDSTVGRLMQPIDLVVGSKVTKMPEVLVYRPDPINVRGRVFVDERWAAQKGVSNQGPTVILIFGPNGMRTRDRRSRINLAPDGSFSFHAESAEGTALIELSLADVVTVVPVTLLPDQGSVWVDIAIP